MRTVIQGFLYLAVGFIPATQKVIPEGDVKELNA